MNQYTIEDIQTRTALSRNFINKCNSKLADLLAPFRMYGEKNKLLFNYNGLQIWDMIKQHKERGESLPHIREAITKVVQPNQQADKPDDEPDKSPAEAPQTSRQNTDVGLVVSALQSAYESVIREMSSKVELLEAGRANQRKREEELRKQIDGLNQTVWTESQKLDRRTQILTKLEQLEGKWGRGKQRRELYTELKRLDAEAQHRTA